MTPIWGYSGNAASLLSNNAISAIGTKADIGYAGSR